MFKAPRFSYRSCLQCDMNADSLEKLYACCGIAEMAPLNAGCFMFNNMCPQLSYCYKNWANNPFCNNTPIGHFRENQTVR